MDHLDVSKIGAAPYQLTAYWVATVDEVLGEGGATCDTSDVTF